MLKKEFKIGDKVRVNGYSSNGCMHENEAGVINDVFTIGETVLLRVVFSRFETAVVPPSQAKLRKFKPKTEPRTFWINLYSSTDAYSGMAHATKSDADKFASPRRTGCIEVREVKKNAK